MEPSVRTKRWSRFPQWFVRLSIAAVLWVASLNLGAAERFYRVKRGDTLYGVARKYGVSLQSLADRNGLKPTAWLLIGQKLAIPSSASASRPSEPTLSREVQRAIASARVKSGRWKRIVIHHSGTAEATIKGMNAYHLKERHMINGLAYHFVIGNGRGMGDGEIYVGNRWKKQLDGGHLASESQNATSLGICLVGNFDQKVPTVRQMRSLKHLVEALQQRCRLGDRAVVTHRQINVIPTRCPGSKFPWDSFVEDLAGESRHTDYSAAGGD